MTAKKKQGKNVGRSDNYDKLFKPTRSKPKVQEFGKYQAEPDHKRFDQMIDETIYIIKIETLTSNDYGAGYKLWFKDMPNAEKTYTAAVFGQYVVPQLDQMFALSHKGVTINPDNPVKTTIRKAGNTYHFE